MTARLSALLFVLLVLAPSVASAQARRVLILPKVGSGATPFDPIRPKYLQEAHVAYTAIDYGMEDVMLASAVIDPATHALICANVDAICVPADLTAPINLTALATVQTRLEGLFVPAEHFTQATTYQQAIREIVSAFAIFQRIHGQSGIKVFGGGVTLDSRLNQIPAATRTALSQAAISLGLDISGLTNTTTIREALRLLGPQLPTSDFGS